jgi:6-phosphogluconolactonase/glucosamine-6-phosphate isomerase/deaminase
MQQILSYTQEIHMWWTVCSTVQQYMCAQLMVFVLQIGPDPHTCRLAPQISQMSQQPIASAETKALGKLKAAASNPLQIIDTQLAN